MTRSRKRWREKHRDCVVCSERFEVGQQNSNAKTCGPECSKERRRQTKVAYRPIENAKRPLRRLANLEVFKEKEARWAREQRAKNPEPGRERSRLYRADHLEEVKAAKHRHYVENREQVRAAQKEWDERNRPKINARRRRDYAAKKGAPVRPWRRKAES